MWPWVCIGEKEEKVKQKKGIGGSAPQARGKGEEETPGAGKRETGRDTDRRTGKGTLSLGDISLFPQARRLWEGSIVIGVQLEQPLGESKDQLAIKPGFPYEKEFIIFILRYCDEFLI